MKPIFLKVIFVILMFVFGMPQAHATTMCVVGDTAYSLQLKNKLLAMNVPLSDPSVMLEMEENLNNWSNNPSCRQLKAAKQAIEATLIGITIVGAGAGFCGPYGAAATVLVTLAGAGFGMINLKLEEIPCQEGDSEQTLKKVAQQEACSGLERSNIQCRN